MTKWNGLERTPLKRLTPLTRTSSLQRMSKGQAIELGRRQLLKYELFLEQEGKCKTCGKFLSYSNEAADNYPHLSHEKPLGRGGETTRKNCQADCAECHSNKKHNLRNIYNEQPNWSRK